LGPTEEGKAYGRAKVIEGFEKLYGITPTFSLVGGAKFSAFNHYFPKQECQVAIDKQVRGQVLAGCCPNNPCKYYTFVL
jgi:hypothetical protein